MRSGQSLAVPNRSGFKAHAVERLGADRGDAGEVGERGQQIDGAGDLRDTQAGRDVAGPANQERRADAAFIGRWLCGLSCRRSSARFAGRCR